MATTAQALADAITAAQGPAQDADMQADANLKLAQGIFTWLTTMVTVNIAGNTAGGDPVVPATGTLE